MPLNTAGQIIYHAAYAAGETRFQADPPVCNLCQREITPQTFGWTSLERDGATQGYVEFISCTACTAVREVGQPLRDFLARHKL